jgi:hypothetical protein
VKKVEVDVNETRFKDIGSMLERGTAAVDFFLGLWSHGETRTMVNTVKRSFVDGDHELERNAQIGLAFKWGVR